MDIKTRHAVTVDGSGDRAIVFVHGYGCDKTMWRKVAPAFEDAFTVVTYDLMGCGASATSDYDATRYGTLAGHADDLVAVLEGLGLRDVIAVGHSVSAMIVALAANARPDLVERLVMVCPSPSYMDDGDYVGGFARADLEGLLEVLDANYLGWSSDMAPAIMGTPDAPEHGQELVNSFCQADPDIAKHFAEVTFLSDHRADVKAVRQPTLVLQCRDDILVPPPVRDWLSENMPRADMVMLDATGHCPHVSFPQATIAAIRAAVAPVAAR
ncbi:alpha/beta hydrolase [Jannaschia sp. Os4]|uniref:alpha/beta fold hydrolase n=1 Tax=Jannaschia sp. Os4 TaxID=2807617 RepID=UPI00193A4DE7|nr:alpha/beta hydrolase [Jannaschia sp. Os4]MBM2575874.1 alpha/beta hydrolase [Jannaschia sp. Os4]